MYLRSLFFALLVSGCTGVQDGDTDDETIVVDNDGDGFPFEEDCNDSDASIYPGAPEDCGPPLVDSNCDGFTGGLDEDNDGFRACDDCDDGDAERYPNATEQCDGVDNDCDGDVDDDDANLDMSTALDLFVDGDGDGFGDDEQSVVQCAITEGLSDKGGDCNDNDAAIHPDAPEVCDYIDNNCDGRADRDDPDVELTETDPVCYTDTDKDGYGADGDDGVQACFCRDDEAEQTGDCDDTTSVVNPEADFQPRARDSGSWDWNCDEEIEVEYVDIEASCSVSRTGTTCDFFSGLIGDKLPKCGEEALYMDTCKPAKSPSGLICESTTIDVIQRCR